MRLSRGSFLFCVVAAAHLFRLKKLLIVHTCLPLHGKRLTSLGVVDEQTVAHKTRPFLLCRNNQSFQILHNIGVGKENDRMTTVTTHLPAHYRAGIHPCPSSPRRGNGTCLTPERSVAHWLRSHCRFLIGGVPNNNKKKGDAPHSRLQQTT